MIWIERLAGALVALGLVAHEGALAVGPVDEVDPRIGVRSENCVVGPCMPNGSAHPSPETPEDESARPGNDGYHPAAPIIGFSQLHAQGTGGHPSYGQILLSPQADVAETDPALYASPKSDEIARIDYYAVTLDRTGIRCEVVPTRHGAIYRFTYPAGVEPVLVVDAGRKIGGPSLTNGEISVVPAAGRIAGHGRYTSNWRGTAFDLHYVLETSEPIVHTATYLDDAVFDGALTGSVNGDAPTDRFGVILHFDGEGPRVIEVRVAISFRDDARAHEWLSDELAGRSLETLRTAAEAAWSAELGRVTVEGASDAERTIFYTALARCFVQPRDRTGDVAGLGDTEPFWDDHYTLWDTYRTLWPLLALIAPDRVASVLEGFQTTFARSGRVGTAAVGTQVVASDHQGGTEVDNVIGDAFLRGVPGVDWESLYAIVRHDADEERPASYLQQGFVAYPIASGISASATLAFALNDYAAYRLACGLGHAEDADRFGRARTWRSLWNDAATRDGFTGFILPKDAGGTFRGDPDSLDGFYEASSWAYSFAVPHELPEVIALSGGAEAFNERLVHGFETERLAFDNEPDFLAPWLHVYAGRPDLTAERVRELLSAYTAERYPGQEDAGAQASRYVFAALGLCPVVGVPIYLVNGPLFERATIRLDGGRELVIERVGARDAIYVRSLTLNGTPLDRAWITHAELAGGGVLAFEMGATPGGWGRDAPPPSGLDDVPCVTEPVPPPGLVRVFPQPFDEIVSFRPTGLTSSDTYSLRIFDAAGRVVAVLAESVPVEIGGVVRWDGRARDGRRVGAGVYFYRMETPRGDATGRLVRRVR